MRVHIHEKNSFIEFPDDMPSEEMQKVIEENWDNIPMRKRVLGKSAEILSALGGNVLESLKGTSSQAETLGKQVVGLGEAAGMAGSGLIGSAAGGVVGLRRLLAGEDPDKVKEEIAKVSEALTYQPQTEWGKHYGRGVEYGLGLISKA